MASDVLNEEWPTDVIRFLQQSLPTSTCGGGWEHYFMTAYQIGCEALVALGQAEKRDWGAVDCPHTRLPEVLPRWDDICVTVLSVATQNNLLEYHRDGGSKTPSSMAAFTLTNPRPAAYDMSSIAAARGLGFARARPDVVTVLQSLNLVDDGRWTDVAETVLWREAPLEWQMNITSDHRFQKAVRQACETMPDDIRAEIQRLALITDADVTEKKALILAGVQKMREDLGSQANIHADVTPEGLRRSLELDRRAEFDRQLLRRWRLAEGWLTPSETKKILNIFHDRLVPMMRRGIAAQFFPDVPFLIERRR